MRKIRYSAGVKAIMLALQELFSVALVVCIVLVTTLFDSSLLDFKDLQNQSFWSSGYYNGLFEQTLQELLDYQVFKNQFETDGSYNPQKAVNVVAYLDTHTKNRGHGALADAGTFRYYLEDLEDWSRDYYQTTCRVESQLYLTSDGILHQQQILYSGGKTVKESENQIDSLEDIDHALLQMIVSSAEYYYGGNYKLDEYGKSLINGSGATVYTEISAENDIVAESAQSQDTGAEGMEPVLETAIQKIRDGKLFQLNIEELKLILNDLELLGSDAVSEFNGIQEDYLTVDGTSIIGEYLAGTITVNEMEQVYTGLEYTLNTIGEEINAYRRLASRFGQEESNLKFWIYNEIQNQYYTNLSGDQREKELSKYGKELGSYLYYSKSEVRLDTNVRGMEDIFYDNIESYNNSGNQVIFIGVDTSLPYEDVWKNSKQEYQKLQPWTKASLILAMISACGLFLSFVYLGVTAGRRSEDDEVHLTWFDKIKTEFLLIAFSILGIGSIIVLSRLVLEVDAGDTVGMMIMGGGIVFSIVAVFDILFMSFVRRLKAGIMWSGSLMHWIGECIRSILNNWKPTLRILVAFALHTAIIIILGLLLMNGIYRSSGGFDLLILAAFLLLTGLEAKRFWREGIQRNALISGIRQIAAGDLEYKIDTIPLKGDNKAMGEAINTIGDGLFHAVEDGVKNERLKADLITNVSHDIKTPLTSIINYVDLLRRENLDNERARSYIQILDAKSQRLKQLTEDLVEVSRISSGNITLQMDRLNLVELVYQSAGEFAERFEERNLTVVTKLPGEPVIILADGRRIWRVLENLYNNVAKYAMENTRVYVDMEVFGAEVVFSVKNISRQALNIDASELTERFIRGDVSRSTEGSGLGLSIAQNLTNLMGGTFQIYLDGDLFKVTVSFPVELENEKSRS